MKKLEELEWPWAKKRPYLNKILKEHFPESWDEENLEDAYFTLYESAACLEADGFDKVNDVEVLGEIRKHLEKITRKRMGLSMAARSAIQNDIGYLQDKVQAIASGLPENHPFASSHIWDNIEAFEKLVSQLILRIENDPMSSKRYTVTNHLEIRIAGGCREIWKLMTNKDAPKILNEAGRFGKFVLDIWKMLELEGKPRSAFQSWKKRDA